MIFAGCHEYSHEPELPKAEQQSNPRTKAQGPKAKNCQAKRQGAPTHLDLRLRHAEGVGQLGSLGARQVLGLFEGLLEREDLLAAEGGARVLLLAVFVHRHGWDPWRGDRSEWGEFLGGRRGVRGGWGSMGCGGCVL